MKNLAFILLCLLAFGCSSEQSTKSKLNISAELAGIEQTRNSFQSALKEKNYDIIRGLVTKDVITISPGSEDWNTMYKKNQERGPFPYDSIIMNPSETVIVSDSIAYDFGVSKVYYTDSIGNVVELKDSFLAILKKEEDGIWRLHREVASSKVLK